MHVIVSHDIDHLTVTEHCRDMILPKFLIRSKIELLSGKISLAEFFSRMGYVFRNKWQNLEELMDFNSVYGIPSTFFIGVNRGKGLVYPRAKAAYWINRIRERGFQVGVHGIRFESLAGIQEEYDVFHELSGMDSFGIRMHYLRRNEDTLSNLEAAGYDFDSSEYAVSDPYMIGRMWEFPLHIMDGYIIQHSSRFQNTNLRKAKELTIKRVEEVSASGCRYLTVLFHDRYFNNGFRTWMEWYVWFMEWIKSQGMGFTDYPTAISTLGIETGG